MKFYQFKMGRRVSGCAVHIYQNRIYFNRQMLSAVRGKFVQIGVDASNETPVLGIMVDRAGGRDIKPNGIKACGFCEEFRFDPNVKYIASFSQSAAEIAALKDGDMITAKIET